MTAQRPTLPGKVDGIVGWEPLELQCRQCGDVFTGSPRVDRRRSAEIILSGFRFHVCDGHTGRRHCPTCLAAAVAACPNTGRHQ